MKIVFMGTPEFAAVALEALAAVHEVVAVYTQPPRPAGRGQALRPSPVQVLAERLGLPVRSPVSLRSDSAAKDLADTGAEVAVVAAYGLILPQAALDALPQGCLNIHASLLPRWRGAAPIHRAVLAGDAETGICIMRMEAGLDTGPVLLREATAIGAEETTGDLHDRLAAMGARLAVKALAEMDNLAAVPQGDGATYAAKIDKAEARIDWTRPAAEVDRQVRGLSPFPGAWCLAGGERVKILRCRQAVGAGEPGAVSGAAVACGTGAIEILAAQREGRKAQPAAEFFKGFAPGRFD
jgi:methionyl-tRNA formyltransferase